MTVCERCILADCDDKAVGCVLRQLARRADWKRKNGQADGLTTDELEAITDYRQMWRIEDAARKSEAAAQVHHG